jgi:hypothetical protein
MILEIDISDVTGGYDMLAFAANQLDTTNGWPTITGVATRDEDGIIWADTRLLPVTDPIGQADALLVVRGKNSPMAIDMKIDGYRAAGKLVADYQIAEVPNDGVPDSAI